jgi:hypothetical protein
VTFIEPISTYGDGVGIFRRYPWIFFSITGMLIYSAKNTKYLIVVLCILFHVLFYVSYTDFIPTGIWRYFNIHYFKWIFPLLGMFAWASIRDLVLTRNYRLHGILALGLLIVLSIRLSPYTIAATSAVIAEENRFDVGFQTPVTIRALDFPKASGSFNELLFNMHEVSADGKALVPISDFRALPMPFGVRLIFNRPLSVSRLSGAFKGQITFDAAAPTPVGRRFSVSWGVPCWIAKRACPTSATLP